MIDLIRRGFGLDFDRRSTSRLSAIKSANDRKGAISIFGDESVALLPGVEDIQRIQEIPNPTSGTSKESTKSKS